MNDVILKKLHNKEYPYQSISQFSENTLESIHELFLLLKKVHVRLEKEGYKWRDGKYEKVVPKYHENPKH